MPKLQVTTKAATQAWVSPDGKIKIFDLELEWQGKPVKAKTYSEAIASPGWSGEVETYEKEGRNGSQTFVKQPQREGYAGGGGFRGGGARKEQDPFTMYLSYAKDLAVALIAHGLTPSIKVFETEYAKALAIVEAGGAQLYAGRKEAQEGNTEAISSGTDTVHDVPDEPVDLKEIDAAFGGETVDAGETPWPPK